MSHQCSSIFSYSLFLRLHHSNLPLFFHWKNKDICLSAIVTWRSLRIWIKIRSLYCHCTRNTTLMGPLGLCTRGFDGVDEWIPISLTPADWEDVEGVHVNYQLWHRLFQACKSTFCSTLSLHIWLYFTYSVILNYLYQKKKIRFLSAIN